MEILVLENIGGFVSIFFRKHKLKIYFFNQKSLLSILMFLPIVPQILQSVY